MLENKTEMGWLKRIQGGKQWQLLSDSQMVPGWWLVRDRVGRDVGRMGWCPGDCPTAHQNWQGPGAECWISEAEELSESSGLLSVVIQIPSPFHLSDMLAGSVHKFWTVTACLNLEAQGVCFFNAIVALLGNSYHHQLMEKYIYYLKVSWLLCFPTGAQGYPATKPTWSTASSYNGDSLSFYFKRSWTFPACVKKSLKMWAAIQWAEYLRQKIKRALCLLSLQLSWYFSCSDDLEGRHKLFECVGLVMLPMRYCLYESYPFTFNF